MPYGIRWGHKVATSFSGSLLFTSQGTSWDVKRRDPGNEVDKVAGLESASQRPTVITAAEGAKRKLAKPVHPKKPLDVCKVVRVAQFFSTASVSPLQTFVSYLCRQPDMRVFSVSLNCCALSLKISL